MFENCINSPLEIGASRATRTRGFTLASYGSNAWRHSPSLVLEVGLHLLTVSLRACMKLMSTDR
ncbi:hypothetical protein GGD63_007966 [Bradyrhizobium sp. cir1]|nr:hypothetical protein [Bradyrhizobium sp. cir1]